MAVYQDKVKQRIKKNLRRITNVVQHAKAEKYKKNANK